MSHENVVCGDALLVSAGQDAADTVDKCVTCTITVRYSRESNKWDMMRCRKGDAGLSTGCQNYVQSMEITLNPKPGIPAKITCNPQKSCHTGRFRKLFVFCHLDFILRTAAGVQKYRIEKDDEVRFGRGVPLPDA